MTDPVPPITNPSAPLPYVISAAIQEALDQSRALGLTWSLRMATVITAVPLTILYDADTVVINAVSMIGTPTSGARVYVLGVPPSGNFVVGATKQPTRYIGCNAGTAGGTPAGSTGSEVAFPSSAWNVAEDRMFFGGQRLFRADLEVSPNCNDAGAHWATYRLRQGQQTTGGQVLGLFYIQYPAGFTGAGASNKQYCFFKNSRISGFFDRLSLTVLRVFGAGTFGIYGGDAEAPTTIVVQDIGAISDNPTIAAFAREMA